MKEIYLNHISLQDFRTFGDFEMEIPDRPGLTMVVGTNGLGKSSFFDAMEWNLSGVVRRFEPYLEEKMPEEKYLTRREATPGAHNVAMSFTNGACLHRLGRFHLGAGSDQVAASDIAEALRDPSWALDIGDIGAYLALTHFLGQAAEQRFTSRNHGDQWNAIRGPSGIGRLEAIREALRGRPSTLAFSRREKAEADEISSLKERIGDWERRQTQLQRLLAASSAAALPIGEDLQAKVDELAANFSPAILWARRPPSIDAQLTALRDAIGERRIRASARVRMLQDLESLATRFPVLKLELAAQKIADDAAQQAKAAAELAHERAHASTELARKARDDKMGELTAAIESIARMEAVRTGLEKKVALEATVKIATDERNDLAIRREAMADELRTLDKAIADARQTLATLLELEGACEVAEGHLGLAVDAEAKRQEAARRRADAVQLRNDAADDESTRATLILAGMKLELQIGKQTETANAARLRASEMARATAALAAHVHADDTTCPLCHSDFPKGALYELARSTAETSNSELTMLEADLVRLNTELATSSASLSAINIRLKAVQDAEALATHLHQEAVDLDRKARALVGATEDATLAEAAQVNFERARNKRDLVLARKPAADQVLTGQSKRAEVQGLYEGLTIDFDAADARLQTLSNELRACVEELNARGDAPQTADGVTTFLQSLLARRTGIIADLASLEANLTSGTAALEEAQSVLQNAISEATREHFALIALVTEMDNSLKLWGVPGMEGEPNLVTLRKDLSDQTEALAACSVFEAQCDLLAKAQEAERQNVELRELLNAMRAVGGQIAVDDPAAFLGSLKARLKSAQEAQKATKAARKAVNQFADKLRERSDGYSKQFLTPLNDLVGAFNDALLASRGPSIRFQADYRVDRSRLDMALQYRDKVAELEEENDLPPQVVLSEGQLAANGLSILCAASTAYKWSLWRALLLDDPLQHNDVIHLAAFVDVMRNLVEKERYQIIMSSHDWGEADYISRKFDAANLPCTLLRLTAPSKSGVMYEPPAHNSAASAALRSVA